MCYQYASQLLQMTGFLIRNCSGFKVVAKTYTCLYEYMWIHQLQMFSCLCDGRMYKLYFLSVLTHSSHPGMKLVPLVEMKIL